MGRKRAMKIIAPDRPLRAGHGDILEVHLRIPNAVEVQGIAAHFEGRCRSAFSGQDSVNTLCCERLIFPIEPVLLPSTNGKANVLPAGSFRLPLPIRVPSHIPGTFTAKHGAIAYRVTLKMKLRRVNSQDDAVLEAEKDVDVIGNVDGDSSVSLENSIERHLKKTLLGFNRLDAKIQFEVEKNNFLIGEHILVTGKVHNLHPSNIIKHVFIELRQKVLYSSGESKKTDQRLITKLICGSVAPEEEFALHHSIQIPMDCYPTLDLLDNPIQVTYSIIVSSSGHFELELPVAIGNYMGAKNRKSIEYHDDKSNAYYCVPPSDCSASVKEGPPPYSSPSQGRPFFIPIRMLHTPHRPFMPPFGYRSPQDFPPQYHYDTGPGVLKIEEIFD
ncbi:unnamed protein product [Auanema sp. JU1783]|nr:unnamed protein product [Auanema sp. JU1783]